MVIVLYMEIRSTDVLSLRPLRRSLNNWSGEFRQPLKVDLNDLQIHLWKMDATNEPHSAVKFSKDFEMPSEFPEILRNLTREILRENPQNIEKFGA